MDSKVSAATWAMDRGVSVVICNGMQEKAIKAIVGGRKVGTFFTESVAGPSNSVESMAENGNKSLRMNCGGRGHWSPSLECSTLAHLLVGWLIGGFTLKV